MEFLESLDYTEKVFIKAHSKETDQENIHTMPYGQKIRVRRFLINRRLETEAILVLKIDGKVPYKYPLITFTALNLPFETPVGELIIVPLVILPNQGYSISMENACYDYTVFLQGIMERVI